MFDKWKIKQVLCKVHKTYRKKAESFLYSYLYTHEEYAQLQDIQYATAYVLCEYFDFNYEFYYNYFPHSYKWYIAYDYIQRPNMCKKAYEKITKQNKTNYNIVCSINEFIDNYHIKGNIIYNMENRCLYFYDGKDFLNIC